MTKRSNQAKLVYDAFRYGKSIASTWHAYKIDRTEYVEIWHHATHMFNVFRAGEVVPVNSGYGSTTDRCGVRKITAGYNGQHLSVGYRELYQEDK